MARLYFPTREEWEVLKEFLEKPIGVIVSPDVSESLTEEEKEKFEAEAENYDCGGEADVWLDVVYDRDHYFVRNAFQRDAEDEDGEGDEEE